MASMSESGVAAEAPPGLDTVGRIKQLRPRLTEAMQQVADAVVADPGAIESLSAAALAERAQTSQASVTRFGQALGFDSYQELRLTLARERGEANGTGSRWSPDQVGPEISPTDSLPHVVAALSAADIRSVHETARTLDLAALEAAAQAISQAGRIDLYGVGGSHVLALETEMRLFRIGCAVRAWADVHEAVTSASLLTPADVIVAFTYSGETREVFEAVEVARSRGATAIIVTHSPGSSVSLLADINLVATDAPTSFRDGGFASRHSSLLVVDCLYVRVAQITYDRSRRSLELTSDVQPRLSVHGRRRRRPDRGGST